LGMIWKSVISTVGHGEEAVYHPPKRNVELEVIAGMAHLAMYDIDEQTHTYSAEPSAVIEVPAKALLRALSAAVQDDEDRPPSALERPGRLTD